MSAEGRTTGDLWPILLTARLDVGIASRLIDIDFIREEETTKFTKRYEWW